MREIRQSGSEGGGAGNSTGPPYPYREGGPLGLKNLADAVSPVPCRPTNPPEVSFAPRGSSRRPEAPQSSHGDPRSASSPREDAVCGQKALRLAGEVAPARAPRAPPR